MFGVKEKKNPVWHVREREDKELAQKIAKKTKSDVNSEVDIEEVHRVGKYQEGKDRPLKVRFSTQVGTEEVLAGAWRLAKTEEYKEVWIKKDMNEEERIAQRGLVDEAKQKNKERSEQEKEKFYWRVIDMRLRKWYKKREREN